MRQRLGEGNYHYIIGIGDSGFDNEDEEGNAPAEHTGYTYL